MNQAMLDPFVAQNIGSENALDGSFAPPEGPAFHSGTFGFPKRVPSFLRALWLLLLFLLLLAPSHALPFLNQPGKRVKVSRHLVEEKTTVVFFHAPWSKTSGRYLAELEKWSKSQDKIAVLGVRVKKLSSPVAKQYKLKAVPAFLIFDEKGEQTHSGDAATAEVLKLMKS